jgi:hypothetical protein
VHARPLAPTPPPAGGKRKPAGAVAGEATTLFFFLKASHDLVGRVRVAFASCGYPKNTQAFYMVLMTIKFSRH